MTQTKQNTVREPLKYRIKGFFSKPANILLVVFFVALIVLSLIPLITMLSNMFTIHAGQEKKLYRLNVGTFTLNHFQRLFKGDDWSRVNFWSPLINSLIVAIGSPVVKREAARLWKKWTGKGAPAKTGKEAA